MGTPSIPRSEQELTALETAVGAAIFAQFAARLAALRALLGRLLARLGAFPPGVVDFGQAVSEVLRREIPRVLDALPADYQQQARRAVLDAYEIGGGNPDHYEPTTDLETIVTEQAERADRLTRPALLTSPHAARAAVAAVARIETRSKTAIAWDMTRAAAQAQHDEAVDRGWRLIWVGERNACVVCAALIGEHVFPGAQFPHSATFDTKRPRPPYNNDLRLPPRHPNCRCEVQIVAPGQASVLGALLKREARRSIARGWRTASESEGVRLRAASRLLVRGARLPKTVEEAARRAVRRGRFPSSSITV